MKSLPTWQQVYHPGRMYKEWHRLAPEYGEQLYISRADISKGRSFHDNIKLFINWKFWRLWMRPEPLDQGPWYGRFAGVEIGLPISYKQKYEWAQMGQHIFEFDFRLLNVLYIKWYRRRDLTDAVAKRFKKIFGRDVHPYAQVQTAEGR